MNIYHRAAKKKKKVGWRNANFRGSRRMKKTWFFLPLQSDSERLAFVWPTAILIVAKGIALGCGFGFRRLANGHIHIRSDAQVNMAFSQIRHWRHNSWGVSPGYGEGRPSAKAIFLYRRRRARTLALS
jgi:hypothetical protein